MSDEDTLDFQDPVTEDEENPCDSDRQEDEAGTSDEDGENVSNNESSEDEECVGRRSDEDNSEDSMDGTLDKCPICLRLFRYQEIGTPDTCEHRFCLSCILEWADNVSTCPIDRKEFHSLLVLDKIEGDVIRVQELVPRAAQLHVDYDAFSDPTFCEVCGRSDREDRLLLCDDCDDGYHLECLEPPLETVPIADWYCSSCAVARILLASATTEAGPSVINVNPRPSRTRMPRTGLSRRIMQRRRVAQSGISSPLKQKTPTKGCSTERKSTSNSGRGTTKRRKFKRRRVRNEKGKRRGKKRKIRKQRVAMERKPVTSRGRLIQQLGILPPRPGQVYVGLPNCRSSFVSTAEKSTSAAAIRTQRHQAGIAPLRIYSTNDLADYFEVSSEEEGEVGVMRPQPIRIGDPRKRVMASATAQLASTANVLGPILKNQHILLKDKNIHISGGNGRLVPSIYVNPEKLIRSTNAENDSHGYESFGNRGSPSSIRRNGQITVVTSAISGENATSSSSRGTSSANLTSNNSSDPSNSANSSRRIVTGTSLNSQGTAPSSSQGGFSSNDVTNTLEDFNVLDVTADRSPSRKKSNQKENEDDEFNIYSDIEDEPRPVSEGISEEVADLPESSIADGIEGESDTDMVIDEAEASTRVRPYLRESRSSAESSARQPPDDLGEMDDMSRDGSSPALPDVEPDSPLSIPLPDSTPPPSVRDVPNMEDDDTRDMSSEEMELDDEPKIQKDEYDPSKPLTSSEEEEEIPLPKSDPISYSSKENVTSAHAQKTKNSAGLDLSSIPLPNDEYRRPTIQFSIPSRHRIFSMGSLIRRNKGVMKKEVKAGNSISFQSEMSKVFTRNTEEACASGGGEPEKISLVAEIFGSDEEEEEAPKLPEPSLELSLSSAVLSQSGSQSHLEPLPVVESTTEGLEAGKWRKIVEDDPSSIPKPCVSLPEALAKVDEDDDVVVIGETRPEIQIIETPPPEPEDDIAKPNERSQQKLESSEDITASNIIKKVAEEFPPSHFDSLSESDNEFERQRLRERRMMLKLKKKEEEERIPRRRSSRSPKKDKENKRSNKRRRSVSAESNCEEGEILDAPDKKRKKNKKSKKSKKKRRSTRSRSTSVSDFVAFAEKKIPEGAQGQMTEEENVTADVCWKKPSKSSKERNYRDGKPKAESNYFREREKKVDNDAVRKSRDKSPTVRQDKNKEHSPRRRIGSREESTRSSRRSSKTHGKRNHSRHSNRSSSSQNIGRSRSRTPKPHGRRHQEGSFSPRLQGSPDISRSRRESHRSRSPRRRSNRRSRSDKSRQLKPRSQTRSWSRSGSSPVRKKKTEQPIEKSPSKKTKKESKDKSLGENKVKEPQVSVVEPAKDKLAATGEKEKEKKKKKKRREKSISPAKAIFADGDSIVVSLSFQKGKEVAPSVEKDSVTSDARHASDGIEKKMGSRNGSISRSSEKSKSLKKTVLIDLESSPVQEQNIGVSPTLIVLSDDEEVKGNDSDQDRLAVSTTSVGDSGKSPLYRERDCHGVPADSTQIQMHSNEGSEGNEFPHRNSTSESETGNTPRGDALVTSTRDSVDRNGAAGDEYAVSPFTPPKDSSPTDMSMTPPLPPESPPTTAPIARSHTPEPQHRQPTSSSFVPSSATVTLASNPSLVTRPLGVGNIPGLFVPNKTAPFPPGGMIGPVPVVMPNPPIPQLRLPSQNLFNQSVLATVANALYGPLMGAQQRFGMGQQPLQTNPNPASRLGNTVIGKKSGVGGGSVLLPKDQNFGAHRRSDGGGGDSPFSPNSSDGDDLFEPPKDPSHPNSVNAKTPGSASSGHRNEKGPSTDGVEGTGSGKGRPAAHIFDSLFGGPIKKPASASAGNQSKVDLGNKPKNSQKTKSRKGGTKKGAGKLCEGELRLTEEVPTSAVELRVKEKFLRKLNRQERVVEEVKVSLKPHYSKKHITKDEYKDILRRAVPKICHNKTGEINPIKIKELVEAYVKKIRKTKKK